MDDDLIAYLEKKIKTLEAERDHWKSNHDNQVKLKQEITRRPSRFVEMVNEIESLKAELASRDGKPVAHTVTEQSVSHDPDPQDRAARVIELAAEIERSKAELKSFDVNHSGESQLSFFIQRAKEFEDKASRFRVLIDKSEERSRSLEVEIESLKRQLAAAPHWVPVAEFKAAEDVEHAVVFCASLYNPQCDPIDSEAIRLAHHRRDGSWAFSRRFANAEVTHVLVGMSPPSSNEDPRGDGDLLPENERLDDLTRECMRDELAVSSNGIEAAMRRRLMEPFLGSEADVLGATKYQPLDDEQWEYLSLLDKWERASSVPHWYSNVKYRLAKGD